MRKLASRHRTQRSNRQLGGLLASVAGAVIAGTLMAVQRYTGQITDVVAAVADDSVLALTSMALAGLISLTAFVSGASATAGLINWARRRNMHGKFALALLLEALLLLAFGLVGANLDSFAQLLAPAAGLLLCFIMGLQNAIVTKISEAQRRTAHSTGGLAPGLSIEPVPLFCWTRRAKVADLHAAKTNRDELFMLLSLFLFGTMAGALAFETMGFSATLPVVLLLIVVAAPSISVDIRVP